MLGRGDPGSEVYEAGGLILISNFATNPRLTERGLRYTFRVIGRDDVQGAVAAARIATDFPDRPLAVVHDDDLSVGALPES